ncbi:G5 domain-containing protein [Arcanobacterium hippocoleae]
MTIAQALENAEIKLGGQDEISVPLNAKLTDGAEITISRITFSTAAEEFVDSFQNKDEEDSSLPKGEKKISTAGVDGKGTRTFTVKYRDGKEISRQIVAEAITTARVDQITKIGTKENTKNSSSIAAPPAGPAPSPGSARAIAQEMLASRGWGAEQFSCLDALWQRESGWNAHAMNRSSGAYGIPQSLPGSKMAAAGADWQTNPATQIRWGLGYIQGRYGNPCGAWAHSQSVGWY